MNALLDSLLRRKFYFAMALLTTLVVVIGFAPRFNERMLAGDTRSIALWTHVVVASAWSVLLVVQTGLVRAGNVRLHRRLGVAGAILAGLLVIVSVWAAVVSGREHILRGDPGRESFFAIPLSNMVTFAAFFVAALAWRKQPEFHRRLILLAAMSLTVAAFARFPTWIVPRGRFNIATDVFIALLLVRDLIVDRRIHRVYLVGLPALVAFQLLVEWVRVTPAWLDFAGRILRP